MASYYVWSGAAGAGTGADWANAYTTLTLARSGKAAGDVFYVAHDHSESTAGAISIDWPGTIASPNYIYCVDRAGSVPPVSADLRTTAQIATTVNNSITLSGVFYMYGLIIVSGNSTGNCLIAIAQTGHDDVAFFKNCSLRLGSSGTSSTFNFGTSLAISRIVLDNVTLHFAAVAQSAQIASNFEWTNTPSALGGAAVPTALFKFFGTRGGTILVRGVDLSVAGSGKTIIDPTSANALSAKFIDCKINSAATLFGALAHPANMVSIEFIRCGDSGVNYNMTAAKYYGSVVHETTIVHTGGASDGTTPLAWKIVSAPNTEPVTPFETPPIAIWNDVDGSPITVTVQGIWGGGAVPTNADIWIECEYLGDNSSPLASRATSGRADLLATPANIPAGSGTWGGSTTKFAMSATFTPQQKGFVYIRVKAGLASSTFYIDPKPVVT
jgi:hypothetical protein